MFYVFLIFLKGTFL